MRQHRSWRRHARPIMVILERADWPAWLDLTRPDTEPCARYRRAV
jgi:putative SOS response-associated peptidase YedK